ncbi:hypothetical protein ABZ897_17085 [Nonomuraea sp. NPDC046802]|uniref:hypothetical protein n=1 Tax=Nonomuraea sp. NPDC046802 TaxID=3154919 RepID=UPI0033E8ADA1
MDARGIPVTEETRTRIQECKDQETLLSWIRNAATAPDIDIVFDKSRVHILDSAESPWIQRWIGYGVGLGMAHRTAKAILATLEARDIPVSKEVRARLMECGDLTILTPRLDKAPTVNSAEELFE